MFLWGRSCSADLCVCCDEGFAESWDVDGEMCLVWCLDGESNGDVCLCVWKGGA